jgi:hypothetical protein
MQATKRLEDRFLSVAVEPSQSDDLACVHLLVDRLDVRRESERLNQQPIGRLGLFNGHE